jgi:hypothetical protein
MKYPRTMAVGWIVGTLLMGYLLFDSNRAAPLDLQVLQYLMFAAGLFGLIGSVREFSRRSRDTLSINELGRGPNGSTISRKRKNVRPEPGARVTSGADPKLLAGRGGSKHPYPSKKSRLGSAPLRLFAR